MIKIMVFLFISVFINKITEAAETRKNIVKYNTEVIPKPRQIEATKDPSSNIDTDFIEEKKDKKINFLKETEFKLKLGGIVDSQYSHIQQSDQYQNDILANGYYLSPAAITHNGNYNNKNVIAVKSRFDLNPELTNKETDIKAGAFVGIPLLTSSINRDMDPRIAAREYIYFDTDAIRLELGSVESAAARMRVDPSKIASGAGGVYGSWWYFLSLPVFNTSGLGVQDAALLNSASPTFMLYPTLPNEAGFTVQRPLAGGITDTNFSGGMASNNLLYSTNLQGYPSQGAFSNKVSIYTKRFNGIQLGYTYSPTTQNSGYMTSGLHNSGINGISGGYVKDYMSMGINYKKQLTDEVGLGLSATYERGETQDVYYNYNNATGQGITNLSNNSKTERNDLNAFAIGGMLTYQNVAFSTSFGYWGNSLTTKNSAGLILSDGSRIVNSNTPSFYSSTGIGANYGPINVGFTYMHSELSGNNADVFSFGTDLKFVSFKFAKVQPYIELTYFMLNPKGITLSSGNIINKAIANNGYVISIGTRVEF